MKWKPHQWADRQTAAPRKLQALLHTLASFADANGIAYPSQDTIMRPNRMEQRHDQEVVRRRPRARSLLDEKAVQPRKGTRRRDDLHLASRPSRHSRRGRNANRRTAISPPPGKSQKWGSPSGGGKSQKQGGQIATSGKQPQKKELTKKAGVTTAELPAEGGQADRWSSSRVMPASANLRPLPRVTGCW